MEVARQLGITRARVTQLLDLTLLAPEIQAEILEMVAVDGREPLAERELRPLVRCSAWDEQRRVWRRLSVQWRLAGQGALAA